MNESAPPTVPTVFVCFCADPFRRPKPRRFSQKKNPLKNLSVMLRLNPYIKTYRRHALLQAMARSKAKKAKKDGK